MSEVRLNFGGLAHWKERKIELSQCESPKEQREHKREKDICVSLKMNGKACVLIETSHLVWTQPQVVSIIIIKTWPWFHHLKSEQICADVYLRICNHRPKEYNSDTPKKQNKNKYNFLNNSLKLWHEDYMIGLKQNAF